MDRNVSGEVFDHLRAAVNSLKASHWTLFCARLWGAKFKYNDGGASVVIHEYKGKAYLMNYTENQ